MFLDDKVDLLKAADISMAAGRTLEASDLHNCILKDMSQRSNDDNAAIANFNRLRHSFCYSRTGRHGSALTDYSAIAATRPTHKQALKLGFASATQEVYRKWGLTSQSASSLSSRRMQSYEELVMKAERRVSQTLGNFDFGSHVRGCGHYGTTAEFFSFIGDTEVRSRNLSGRGVFATRGLDVGELMLCEKAIATSDSTTATIYERGLQDLLPGEA